MNWPFKEASSTGTNTITACAPGANGDLGSEPQTDDPAVAAPTSRAGCSTHQQLRRTAHPVQLSRLNADTASLAMPSSAGSLMNPVPSPAHSERFRCPSDSFSCCTPTSQSAETLHQLAAHRQQSASELRYGVERVVLAW